MKLWQVVGYGSVILCAVMIYFAKVLEFPIGYFSGVSGFFISLLTTIFLVWPSLLTSIIPLSEEGTMQIPFFLLYLLYSYGLGAILGLLITKLYHEFRPSTVRAARLHSISHRASHHTKKRG